jgi:hypothetical protein
VIDRLLRADDATAVTVARTCLAEPAIQAVNGAAAAAAGIAVVAENVEDEDEEEDDAEHEAEANAVMDAIENGDDDDAANDGANARSTYGHLSDMARQYREARDAGTGESAEFSQRLRRTPR